MGPHLVELDTFFVGSGNATDTVFHGARRTMVCDSPIVSYGLFAPVVVIPPADLATLQRYDSLLFDSTELADSTTRRLSVLETEWALLSLDTTRLGREQRYLEARLDNRYRVSIALDDTTRARYPEAVYSRTLAGALTGQAVYAAATDSATDLKGRGFNISLSQFNAADSLNVGYSLESNWVTCFPASPEPCLDVGSHSFYAWVSGYPARITGTLVLVYAEER
jgi:hypothetical protein